MTLGGRDDRKLGEGRLGEGAAASGGSLPAAGSRMGARLLFAAARSGRW